VYSLFEMRNMVEPEAAALAAERRNTSQIQAMASALEIMSRYKTTPRNGATRTSSFTPRCWKRRAMPFLPR
jgi:DNA-binding FadR family transcriptional regulator